MTVSGNRAVKLACSATHFPNVRNCALGTKQENCYRYVRPTIRAADATELNMSKNYRSAGSGRFVTKSQAAHRPSTTVGETRGGGSTGGTHRSAKTGEFVTRAYAAKHPKTTIKDS